MNPFRRRNQNAMQGGKAAFTPAAVSGMEAWWAARLETGFADNDPVGTITDFSGNGRHLTQGTSSKQPLFLTNQTNGNPAFGGDGVDDFVSGGDILDISTGSIHFFLVFKFDSVAGTTAPLAKALLAGAVNRYAFYQNPADWFGLLQDTSGARTVSGGAPDTSWHLAELILDRPNTKWSLVVDGSEVAANNSVAAGNIDSAYRFLLFAYNNATDTGEALFMTGKIAEVWCWKRVLTSGERTTLRNGINSIYSIY